jgi:biopolymer transport protein ExbB
MHNFAICQITDVMKKLLFVFALIISFSLCSTTLQAQESDAESDSVAAAQVTTQHASLHKQIKQKFVEGSALFMSFVALVFVVGLAFCIERIIYLNMSRTNSKQLLGDIQEALARGDSEAAKNVCQDTDGPVAAICSQGLQRIDQGTDVVEKSVNAQSNIQAAYLTKHCSWIKLFIRMAPALGFLGTIFGMVQAFDKIQQVGEISPSVVAGGVKVALITTIFGLISALILQVFYNYILSKIENINNDIENSSITLLDMVVKYNRKYKR